jgi:hypothetical protein
MGDDLADDQIKLVAYTIVFTKPGQEKVMPSGQGSIVVTDSMTPEQFVAMTIATYMQLKDDEKKEHWREVFKSRADMKYLKVYFAVPTRWPKERPDFTQRQLEALERVGTLLKPGDTP